MNKLKYVYHVAYYYAKDNETRGIGSTTLYRTTKLDKQYELEDAADFLKNDFKFDQVVILNFILLNKRGKR